MKDKYNLNTLPAGLPGMEENEIGVTCLFLIIFCKIIACYYYLLSYVNWKNFKVESIIDFIVDEISCIPGMAPEDRVEGLPATVAENLGLFKQESNDGIIPGLEDDLLDPEGKKKKPAKKQPYAKPIPKNFMAQWNETGMTPEGKYFYVKRIILLLLFYILLYQIQRLCNT